MNDFKCRIDNQVNIAKTAVLKASIVSMLLLGASKTSLAQTTPDVNGSLSNADGSASVSIGKPHMFAPIFLDTDLYTSEYTIHAPPQDRGQLAYLFMAATLNDSWYRKSEDGWQPWNPATEQITPFDSAMLPERLRLEAITYVNLDAGDYEIFAGYQIPGREFVTAPLPLNFRVNDANSQTLHPFTSDSAMETYIKQGLESGATNPEYAVLNFATPQSTTALDANLSGNRVSGTNLQIKDVDEADTVKTDGSNLFTFRDCNGNTCLVAWTLDSENIAATERGSIQLAGSQAAEGMYLIQQRPQGNDLIVTLGGNNTFTTWRDIWNWQNTETQLEFLDASNPADLTSLETLTIDGQLVSSRRVGEVLYLVTRFTPNLPKYQPQAYNEKLVSENQEVLEESTLADLTPKVVNSKKQVTSLISSKNCYLPTNALDYNTNPSVITVTSIPLNSPSE